MAISTGSRLSRSPINGTWEVWPPGSKLFYKGHANVVIHEPIPTADLTVKDIDGLRARCMTSSTSSSIELHQS